MIELTLERTKALLAEAVAERGEDYVYSTPEGKIPTPDDLTACLYVHDRDASGPLDEPVPGCIVGLVLHKAGVPLDVLKRCEHEDASAAVDRSGVSAAEGVSDLLKAVQRRQDAGQPWGQALTNALADPQAG